MEPPPKGARSKEVSGEADGVTLAECLADGRVPVPDRMSFPNLEDHSYTKTVSKGHLTIWTRKKPYVRENRLCT